MNAREGVEALVDAACPDREARRRIDLFEATVRAGATAAAYRAAADELRKDHPDMTAGDGMFRAGILRAATRLRARADEMEQQ